MALFQFHCGFNFVFSKDLKKRNYLKLAESPIPIWLNNSLGVSNFRCWAAFFITESDKSTLSDLRAKFNFIFRPNWVYSSF